MQSFYKIIPPPRENAPRGSASRGYLLRECGDRDSAGGKWLAAACFVLCLSIVVAVLGATRGRWLPVEKIFIPVSSVEAAPVVVTADDRPPVPSFQTATNPLRWADLTLMLRTGLSDDEIIAETAAKQLVVPIGATQETELRDLGAGQRLLAALRGRRLYAAPTIDAPVSSAPAAYVVPPTPRAAPPAALPQTAVSYYSAPPTDYAARDRQVADLQTRIDALDERIRRIRANPGQYWYNRDYGVDRQQGMDRYLNQLDKDRNDLRRQKWQLEGR